MTGKQSELGLNNVPEFSVSQLANQVKKALEDSFGHIRLKGEISGYRGPHSSGHCYFALKDEKARVDAVIWRGVFGKLKFKPEEGMEVIATGKISSYPGSSKYQIVIETMEPAGVGALMALLEERKKKLASEGLFEDSRKQPIPFLPKTVGIVTSPTGAVIRDMMHGFRERFPTHVILWPVRVQGETSAQEVTEAIRGFNNLTEKDNVQKPDLLIVARGGGSLEDLWGFNEENVARAVAESKIPVISAVGHETDWTIIDWVADARAPTPTKAAEWSVPKYSELVDKLSESGIRLSRTTRRYLEEMRSQLNGLSRGLPNLQDLLGLPRQRLDSYSSRLAPALKANAHTKRTHYLSVQGRFTPSLEKLLGQKAIAYQKVTSRLTPSGLKYKISNLSQNLEGVTLRAQRTMQHSLQQRQASLETHSKLLGSLGYQSVLRRGFAIARDETGKMVRSAPALKVSEKLDLEFADGHIQTQIIANEGGNKTKAPAKKTSNKKTKSAGTDQGSLF